MGVKEKFCLERPCSLRRGVANAPGSALFGLGHRADLIPVLEVDEPDARAAIHRARCVFLQSARALLAYSRN
jgi:hypothetical protein